MIRPSLIRLFFALFFCGFALSKAQAAESLAQRLVSRDPAIRLEAKEEFSKLPPDIKERFVPSLMVAITDEDEGVRLDSARLLRQLGVSADRSARDVRKEPVAPKKAESSRVMAYKEIQAAKKEDFQEIDRMTIDEEKGSSSALSENDATRPTRSRGFNDALLVGLSDPDPMVRAHAARRLGTMHPIPPDALPALTDLLNDTDAEVRASAIGTIASFGPAGRSAVPALLRLTGDPDPGVRQLASDALQQVQPER